METDSLLAENSLSTREIMRREAQRKAAAVPGSKEEGAPIRSVLRGSAEPDPEELAEYGAEALPPHTLLARADVPRFYPVISKRFLEKAACTGEGPVMHKIGKRVAYRVSDIEAWLASRARRSTSEAPGAARDSLARA